MISALKKLPGSGRLLKMITWSRVTGVEKYPWISSVLQTWGATEVVDIVLVSRVEGNGPKPMPGQEKVLAEVQLYVKKRKGPVYVKKSIK
jgi:hypothetical protein